MVQLDAPSHLTQFEPLPPRLVFDSGSWYELASVPTTRSGTKHLDSRCPTRIGHASRVRPLSVRPLA